MASESHNGHVVVKTDAGISLSLIQEGKFDGTIEGWLCQIASVSSHLNKELVVNTVARAHRHFSKDKVFHRMHAALSNWARQASSA